ncbi:MAG TPA: glycosyltransferase [Nitrososphaera sp.]
MSGESAAELLARKGYRTRDVYRPKSFDVESGQLRHSFRWLMDYYSYYKRCKAISKVILDENEGLVISDEDFAAIAIAEEKSRRRVIITDITETHFTTGAASIMERKMNKTMQKMMERCDRVIIPDSGQDAANIVHVGPIVRRASTDRDSLRKSLGFTKKTIVLSVGGTDAGKYLIEKTLEAYRKLQGRLDAELVIVSGPSIKLPDMSDYRNLGFVENLHELIYASDLVVSLAGKSTMDESVAYGTPGIFIPIRDHFEQERGAARLGYEYSDINRLETLIEEKLGNRNNSADAKGAERAAKIISNLSN